MPKTLPVKRQAGEASQATTAATFSGSIRSKPSRTGLTRCGATNSLIRERATGATAFTRTSRSASSTAQASASAAIPAFDAA